MDKIIKELHKAYDYFNETKFENKLIPSIIMIQNAKDKKDVKTYGYITRDAIWKETKDDKEDYFHEISISAEYLNRPLEEVLTTLLHEMVHLKCSLESIKEMGRGQYHKEEFKIEAEKVGLIVEQSETRGWNITKPSQQFINEIEYIDLDKEVFNLEKYLKPKERKPSKKRIQYKYECPSCGLKVTSKTPIDSLVCGSCKKEYIWINKEEVEEKIKEIENN